MHYLITYKYVRSEQKFSMEQKKDKILPLLIVILIVVATVGSLSVTGLLQSTEKFVTSGIVVRPPPPPVTGGGGSSPSNPPSPPPPEPVVEVDVYSDSACTQKVTEVSWGEIQSGKRKSNTIYVKNQGDIGIVLSLFTENWTPDNAANYMELSWDYNGVSISPGEVRSIVLTLLVDSNCPAISSFNFNIIIVGS